MFNEKYNGKYVLLSQYKGNAKNIKVKHLDCGCEFDVNAGKAIKNDDICCPKCNPKYSRAIPFVNDLYTTNYDVYELLANKEDGHRYKSYSSKKVLFVCPYCGHVQERSIAHVTDRGLSCELCGKTSGSYAERFFANMLCQLGIDFKKEYSPDWIKPKRYDFYFSLNNSKYIIEIDGKQHFKDGGLFFGQILDERIEIDAYKEKMAIMHGYDVIRIDYNYDCIEARKEYLINSIVKSQISDLFNLNNIDFDICDKTAISNTVIRDVANSWLNGIKNVNDLSIKYNVGQGAIRLYLKIACDANIISYSYEELLEINKQYYHRCTSRATKYDNEVINLWNSEVYDFSRIAREIGISDGTVRNALRRACEDGVIDTTYEELIRLRIKMNPTRIGNHKKKVVCNETGEVFIGFKEANKKYHASLADYFYTNGKKGFGYLPDGTKLSWMKIED